MSQIFLHWVENRQEVTQREVMQQDDGQDGIGEVSLLTLIKEDWVTHQKDWTLPGFRAVAICRFGAWRMTIKSRILRATLGAFYRILYRRARNVYGIELPYTVKLGRRVIVEHQGSIVIHGHSEVGDDCIIRQGISLGNKHPDKPLDAPRLGNRVNIGAGAKLLGGIVVGDDVNIGANAVVTRDVEAGQTVVGIPALPVKKTNL